MWGNFFSYPVIRLKFDLFQMSSTPIVSYVTGGQRTVIRNIETSEKWQRRVRLYDEVDVGRMYYILRGSVGSLNVLGKERVRFPITISNQTKLSVDMILNWLKDLEALVNERNQSFAIDLYSCLVTVQGWKFIQKLEHPNSRRELNRQKKSSWLSGRQIMGRLHDREVWGKRPLCSRPVHCR